MCAADFNYGECEFYQTKTVPHSERSEAISHAPYLAADCRIALRAPRNDDLLLDPSDFENREMWNFCI